MNTKFFNLALLVFWVIAGLALYLREWWMPGEMRQKLSDERAELGVLLAIVLALWNLTRFIVKFRFSSTSEQSPEVAEYRRRIRAMSGEDPKVTDPQFKFDDPSPGNHNA